MSKVFETLNIAIQSKVHRSTGLLVAFSDDLPGLLVHGRTDDEISAKLPGALREILEALGRRVLSVQLIETGDSEPAGFEPRGFRAAAELEAA